MEITLEVLIEDEKRLIEQIHCSNGALQYNKLLQDFLLKKENKAHEVKPKETKSKEKRNV